MKIIMLSALAVFSLTVGSSAFASSVLRHPILLTMDVRDCGANRGMASSIKLTTKFNYVDPAQFSLHFDFKNVANGQISKFEYVVFETTHSMALPGGYYTFIAYYKSDAAPGAPSKSVQLLHDTPIAVPQITSSGLCLNVVDKRVK